jgi:tetratricopeptide (TPR) repeat protein
MLLAIESKPLPISFDNSRVKGDELEQVPYRALTENRWELKDLIGFIKSEDENTKVKMGNDLMLDFFPTQKVRLTVDKAAVIKNKVVNPKYYDSIVPYIDFEIKTTTLTKNRLIMLDILANNNWERPIHFTGGSFGDDDFMWLKDYLQLQGMVYKLVPIKTPVKEDASPLDMGMIDTDKMYDIIMKWDWGNSNHPDIYYDSETRKNSITYRSNAGRLIEALIVEGKKDKALKVIDLLVEKLPLEYYEHYSTIDPFIIGYYEVGQPEKARKLADKLIKKYSNEIAYYQAQDLDFQNVQFYEIARSLSYFKNVVNIFKGAEDQPYYNKYKQIYKQKYRAFSPRLGLKDAGLKEDI